jgi:hypothetical protein
LGGEFLFGLKKVTFSTLFFTESIFLVSNVENKPKLELKKVKLFRLRTDFRYSDVRERKSQSKNIQHRASSRPRNLHHSPPRPNSTTPEHHHTHHTPTTTRRHPPPTPTTTPPTTTPPTHHPPTTAHRTHYHRDPRTITPKHLCLELGKLSLAAKISLMSIPFQTLPFLRRIGDSSLQVTNVVIPISNSMYLPANEM